MTNKTWSQMRGAWPKSMTRSRPCITSPMVFSDRFALGFTKLLRFSADTFFAKRYGR